MHRPAFFDIRPDTEFDLPDIRPEMQYTVLLENFLNEYPFQDRFDKYLDPNFFQHRIHWFSIFNSFMMVIFLVRNGATF
jgi:hypothetical protein